MRRALATCDVPSIIEAVRRCRRWSQTEVGQAIGYSQTWVSKVVGHRQPVTVKQAREVLERLQVPLHMVGLSGQGEGGDDPTRRRELMKTAALAGLALPLPSHVPSGDMAEIDDVTPVALRTVTGSQRRLDASTPSRDLAESVAAHYRMARRVLERGRSTPLYPQLAAAVSEVAGFTAWLHLDMQDLGSAREYYRRSITYATHTNNPMVSGYMLGSLASFEAENEEPAAGLELVQQARRHFGDAPPMTAVAWLSCIEAVTHATAFRATAADRSLRAADNAAQRAADNEVPWPWVFPFDQGKVAGYRALCAVRLGRPREALSAFADAPLSPSPKQAALIQLERASAHVQLGQLDDGFHLAEKAVKVAKQAQSERVLRRARQFRHGYTGPSTAAVKAFDAHMHFTLP